MKVGDENELWMVTYTQVVTEWYGRGGHYEIVGNI